METRRFFSNPGVDEMPRTADLIIIGGGPAGTAALWAIERAAPGTRTVLIEQNSQLASGSSTASLENFRTCWPAPCLARLMQRSVDVFFNAEETLGDGARDALGIKQQGYLFLAFNPGQADLLKGDVEHLHRIGLQHVEYLDNAEVVYRFPWLGEHIVGAKYDPVAGWLDSHALVYQFVRNAPSASILLDVADVAIVVEHGRVTGVSIPNGDIAAPQVVIAAGANARRVGRTAGIELPVVARPRQSFTTPWRHPEFPEDGPCVIGTSPFPHVRPEAQSGAIFGWEYDWNSKRLSPNGAPVRDALADPVWPVEQCKDVRFPSLVLALLARQFHHEDGRGFADSRYLRGLDHRVGYYVYRDDSSAFFTGENGERRPYVSQRAVIDSWPDIAGLTISVAHVGHGIMSAPAAGEIIASKLLDLPLTEPVFADFGLDVPWVEHDSGGISAN
jgi:glycine/D-amino acid oxidase-like deaminating enzyme